MRIFQQILFLSDILGASGKQLDQKYLRKRPHGDKWSKRRFPKECPPNKDFKLWKLALHQVAPPGGIQDRLGRLKATPSKIWDWRYDEDAQRLFRLHRNGMDIYKKSLVRGHGSTANRWTRLLVNQPVVDRGLICSVREVVPAVVAITSTALPVIEPGTKTSHHLPGRPTRMWQYFDVEFLTPD